MRRNTVNATVGVLGLMAGLWGQAQSVPPLINYQGKLMNAQNQPLADGTYGIEFRLWDTATNGLVNGATSGTDFTTVSGRLTLTAAQTQATISVPIIGDTNPEPDETLLLNLSNATSAVLDSNQVVGVILNDDGNRQIVSSSLTSPVAAKAG
jgi:hypothetical protein